MRFPIYGTLVFAIAAVVVSIMMREPKIESKAEEPASTLGGIITAAKWVYTTRFALLVIVAGVCIDGGIRIYYTLLSNYFRLIQIPDALFGTVSAVVSGLSFFFPVLAKRLHANYSPATNFTISGLLALAGLVWMSFAIPKIGVLAALPLAAAMSISTFLFSQYLNEVAIPSMRATILSIKGLAINLGYGWITLLYGLYSASIQRGDTSKSEIQVFAQSLPALPIYYAASLIAVSLFIACKCRKNAGRFFDKPQQ